MPLHHLHFAFLYPHRNALRCNSIEVLTLLQYSFFFIISGPFSNGKSYYPNDSTANAAAHCPHKICPSPSFIHTATLYLQRYRSTDPYAIQFFCFLFRAPDEGPNYIRVIGAFTKIYHPILYGAGAHQDGSCSEKGCPGGPIKSHTHGVWPAWPKIYSVIYMSENLYVLTFGVWSGVFRLFQLHVFVFVVIVQQLTHHSFWAASQAHEGGPAEKRQRLNNRRSSNDDNVMGKSPPGLLNYKMSTTTPHPTTAPRLGPQPAHLVGRSRGSDLGSLRRQSCIVRK